MALPGKPRIDRRADEARSFPWGSSWVSTGFSFSCGDIVVIQRNARMLTPAEVAVRLAIDVDRVRSLIRNGLLRAVDVSQGTGRRAVTASIDRLIRLPGKPACPTSTTSR